jgi:hypothetical protein
MQDMLSKARIGEIDRLTGLSQPLGQGWWGIKKGDSIIAIPFNEHEKRQGYPYQTGHPCL